MSIEPARNLNSDSLEEEKGAKNAADGVNDISAALPIRQTPFDEGEEDPGRVSHLEVFYRNGKLKRNRVLRKDSDKREEIIYNDN